MKRILVTGATGFVGQHCLLSLLKTKMFEVHAVSSKPNKNNIIDVHWHQVDLFDSEQIVDLISNVKPSHLLHLAWYTVPGKYLNSLENIRWVQISLTLLQAFANNGGERVVMAGTCAEYDWKYGFCTEGITPIASETTYGKCKHSLQIMLEAFCKEAGISSAWGRIFFIYGPHENPNRLVPFVICSLLKAQPARCSQGKQIRDYLYIQDVADALIALLKSEIQGAINIGSGNPVSLKEIVYKIADKLNRKDLVRLGAVPASANESRFVVANVGRLFDEVGWRPKHTLDTGLESAIEWWKRNN